MDRTRLQWALYDCANAGYSTVIHTFVFAAYFTRRVAVDEVEASARWGDAVAAAGLVVAVAGPVLGAAIDQGGRRKPWIAGFTGVAVLAVAGLAGVGPDPQDVPLAVVLVATAAATGGLAFVFYEAMLPELAPEEHIGRWSGFGWGLGYLGGLACLGLAYVLFLGWDPWVELDGARGLPVRATCLLAAGWYAVFAVPLLWGVPEPPRRGPRPSRALLAGLRQLRGTLRDARRHASLIRFLLARMLYVDGLATVFAFGGVFAAGTFAMDERRVLVFGVVLSLSAGAGAWLFGGLDDRVGGKRVSVLALLGLLGTGAATIAAPDEPTFWAAGAALGLFVGPVQAASRSYLSRMAPAELRTEMFGLYALAGKLTAFVGPFLVGRVATATGSQRIGMTVILALLASGLALLATVESDAPQERPGASA